MVTATESSPRVQRIAESIRCRLRSTHHCPLRWLRIQTNGETINIAGKVASYHQYQVALSVIRETGHGTAIDCSIVVSPREHAILSVLNSSHR